MVRQRLSEGERRREILEAACACFLEQGFAATTMEAVIARTSLSKGGVYRYYPSTTRMLADLMKQGTQHRLGVFRKSWHGAAPDPEQLVDLLTESLYQKIVDENPYKKLYAQFLLEAPKDKELLQLKEELVADFFSSLSHEDYASPQLSRALNNTAFIEFINAMITGTELMGMRPAFKGDPGFLKGLIRPYFQQAIQE